MHRHKVDLSSSKSKLLKYIEVNILQRIHKSSWFSEILLHLNINFISCWQFVEIVGRMNGCVEAYIVPAALLQFHACCLFLNFLNSQITLLLSIGMASERH